MDQPIFMKQTLKKLIKKIPGIHALVIYSARLPIILRSKLSLGILSSLSQNIPLPQYINTNLGIDKNYHCLIPHEKTTYLFGKPDYYWGERGPLKLAKILSQQCDAFIDIGAHMGYFTFFIRKYLSKDIPIYYFEPDPELFALIEKNIEKNTLINTKGFKQAIGNKDGYIHFFKNLSDNLSGSLIENFKATHNTQTIEVEIIKYTSFAKTYHLKKACVKVDIENAEFAFLEGAEESLSTIHFLIIEVLEPAIKAGFIHKMIQDYGFYAYYINDYQLEFSQDGSFNYQPPEYNWLFCKEPPDQLKKIVKTIFTIKY